MKCDRCPNERPRANLTMVDGKPVCPECLFAEADHASKDQKLVVPA